MSHRLSFAFLVLASMLALPAGAADGQLLDRFFVGLRTLQTEFEQRVTDPQERLVEESRGTLLVARPDKFRLQYLEPYEQLYVADGGQVWLYDKDLEQVTVKPQSEALSSTPAMLLSTAEPLSRNFEITELGGREGGVTWFELRPRDPESGFEVVRLALQGERLRVMEMVDGFGQKSTITFTRVARNVRLAPDLFRFDPPAGVDVISEAP